MTDLSPQAQAVLDAVDRVPRVLNCTQDHPLFAAAALRALADQVVPQPCLPYDSCCDVHAAAVRAEILAIAAELEGNFKFECN